MPPTELQPTAVPSGTALSSEKITQAEKPTAPSLLCSAVNATGSAKRKPRPWTLWKSSKTPSPAIKRLPEVPQNRLSRKGPLKASCPASPQWTGGTYSSTSCSEPCLRGFGNCSHSSLAPALYKRLCFPAPSWCSTVCAGSQLPPG